MIKPLPVIMLCLLASSTRAQPAAVMFRGDAAHSGQYAGGGERIVGLQWRFPTQGDVMATPLVARGVVYVGSGDGKMYALDERSGDVRWAVSIGAPVQSSAALVNDLVVVGSRDGHLHALDAANGKQRWQLATGKDLPLPWGHESGDVWTSSPTLAAGRILVGGGDGVVYAIDPARGAVLWKAQTGGRIRGTPAVHDNRVFIGSFDGRVYAFDLHDGRRIWRYDTEGVGLNSANFGFDRRSIQSSPSVGDGMVYIGARDGFLYALDERTGALRWKFDHKVSWVNSSPAFAEGVVYAGSSDGHFVQAVDAKTGRELWRANAIGTVWSSPALTERHAYWGDGTGRIFAVDRSNGTQLSVFRTGSTIHSSPTIEGDLLFIGSGDGGVYALRLGSAAAAPMRAVFFDSTYLRVSQVQNAGDVARYLIAGGYTKL
ncbi:MAG TPA: PQQ-binding-like beta-propeller repeat protein, partial [Gemmatimonadaceae bacterium]|nr:PQQ-binding-like beta-propeller repeat protein [Gemmatimonadaceae bacterium]